MNEGIENALGRWTRGWELKGGLKRKGGGNRDY